MARERGEIPKWTGPTLPPLYKNTRQGRLEEYYNRPIVPCAVPSNDPPRPKLTPEQAEAAYRRVQQATSAWIPPPITRYLSATEREEHLRARPYGDIRVFTPKQRGQATTGPNAEHPQREEEVVVRGGEEEGAVGGEEQEEEEEEEEDSIQLLWEGVVEPIQEVQPPPALRGRGRPPNRETSKEELERRLELLAIQSNKNYTPAN